MYIEFCKSMLIVNFVYLLKDFFFNFLYDSFICLCFMLRRCHILQALTFKMLSFMIVLRHHTLAFISELFLLIRVKTTFTVVKISHPGEY